ncbi:putative spermidine/putrescine transport system permease protein [Salsuginibacillus halophilus]|uniref:Putative spermidine/putrescine transport system permease protein n=1 Tax=Salsuginibacillus halophilus TaxID=517424 RepID=A0A2P8H8Q7_9BACI|nr:ABC transporter permease subunit [Salsuginibacillus halophilus]PSL42602.1 putative spermidine/putrescine transport system permease protein [Salsuginibacillus halophilus]
MKLSARSIKLWFALAPAFLLLVGLTGYALFSAVRHSFTAGGEAGFTVSAYASLAADPHLQESIRFSIITAGISTMISLVIGAVLARLLYRQLRHAKLKVLVWLPMFVPHFVGAYIIILLFSQSGLFATIAYQFGWISAPADFPVLTHDRDGYGIILTYIWKEVPFVVLMLLPVYYDMDQRFHEVVRTLGGSRFAAFRDVEWPLLRPSIFETGIILFAFTLGAFEVPALIGATDPQMAALTAYDWFYQGDWSERPEAYALMSALTAALLMPAFLIFYRARRLQQRLLKGGGRS